jgi:hypothetical protein
MTPAASRPDSWVDPGAGLTRYDRRLNVLVPLAVELIARPPRALRDRGATAGRAAACSSRVGARWVPQRSARPCRRPPRCGRLPDPRRTERLLPTHAEGQRAPRTAGQQLTFDFARPCGHRRTTLRCRPMRHGGLHLGEHCADCGRWLRWTRQRAHTLLLAPPRPQR